ncbi:hypothetical protein DM02DRAFT_636575 [Periconia macrospinosa]|uniref:Uncharacterized protein n=1 Tax=Periconia macrospinosa TaxID=97972 RepID=A0A2V1CYG1_9PLEO|nr:hypothetical protein DM02DRAFT_636575 [Periconia macrospinosa]
MTSNVTVVRGREDMGAQVIHQRHNARQNLSDVHLRPLGSAGHMCDETASFCHPIASNRCWNGNTNHTCHIHNSPTRAHAASSSTGTASSPAVDGLTILADAVLYTLLVKLLNRQVRYYQLQSMQFSYTTLHSLTLLLHLSWASTMFPHRTAMV